MVSPPGAVGVAVVLVQVHGHEVDAVPDVLGRQRAHETATIALAAPEIEFRVIAARDEFFDPDNWWHTREARKVFVLEWFKTIASWFGI